ncbi:sulfotransferase family protein [Glycomyces buryatensis]|nr:sulfotransferase [Glycomyces buryatensis]
MRRISYSAHVVNGLLTPFTAVRRDPQRALEAWRRKASAVVERSGIVPDAEDSAFADDLGFMLQCFARVPGLTPIGWIGQLSNAASRLENRLRIKRIIAENPAVAAEPIDDPIFVVGLPRTATSLTHKILARSEPHRGPLLWELIRTDLEQDPRTTAKRIGAIEKELNATFKFSPLYDVIHPVRADQPEESIAIMPRTYFPLSCALMPDYREWLDQVDVTADYEYLKQALQVLQHGRDRRRWILKFPGHVAHLDTIHKVFPGAQIVWTHRDPVTVMGSFCSLVETLGRVHARGMDQHEIGRMWLGILSDSIEQGRSKRLALPRESVVDVSYHQLVADPHHYVPALYERLGAKWTNSDAANLEGVLNGPNRDRQHEYALDRYGLSPAQVEEAFGDYSLLVANLRS